MSPLEIRIATTDLSAGLGPEQLRNLKAMLLGVYDCLDNQEDGELDAEGVGKLFITWAKDVRIQANQLN